MEPIKQGYLTKSPPEKKIHERKFFKAKWRKRYFVLHLPPSSLPGNYALDYFGDSHCKKVLGSIDLTQCELIHSALNSSHYKYLFSLKTKHKGKSRTYFLAADTEEEMTKWVECLCKVCGFLPDVVRDEELPPQASPVPSQPPQRQQPATVSSPPRTEEPPPRHDDTRYTQEPKNNNIHVQDSYIPLEECYSDPKKAREVKLPTMPASPLDVVPPAPGDSMWGGGRRKSTESIPDEPPPPPPSKTGIRDTQRPIDAGKTAYINLDNMDEGLYKVPPRGDFDTRQSEVYQVPPSATKSYQEGPPVTDDFYAVPPRWQEEKHNMARDSWNPVSPAPQQTRQSYGGDDWYDVPPQRTVNQRESVSSKSDNPQKRYTTGSQGTFDDIYDIPKSDPLNQVPQAPYQGSPRGRESVLKGQETYDIPKSASNALHQVPKPYHSSTIGRDSRVVGQETYDIPPARHAVSETSLLGSVPPPPVKDVGGESLHQQTKYYNLNPASQPIYNAPRPLTRNLSVNVPPADDTYDVLPQKSNDANILGMSFPPPKSHHPKPPPQMVGQEPYVPMHGKPQPTGYFAMRSEHLQNYENLDTVSSLPSDNRGSGFHPSHSLHSRVTKDKGSCKAPPLMSMTNVPVRQAHGSYHGGGVQEFYTVRQTQRTQSFKRNIRSDDVLLPTKRSERDSSDSDDESGTSTESHNHSSDSLKNPGLEQKPPAPRKSKEVQYLDLDHSDPEKSPTAKTRSPPVNLISGSATDYGEIDFIKTKALSETKRDVENKRKSSDKSVDE